MKKRTILCLSVAAALLLAACTPAEELPSAAPSEGVESTADADTRRPTIRIAASEVIIGKGDDFDLLDGVVGSDDVDGDITDRIEIDKGDYDPGVAGKYTITYNLTDSAGNAAVPKQRIINVRETDVMEKPPVWNDAIEGEKRNPQDPAVYGGAWYHKVVSSKDKWVGIEATVTLPEFKIERYEGEYDASLPVDPAATHLDNPSVYLGGNAQSESDVGLSLSRVLVDVEKQTLSVGGIAFRPFWRYITAEEQDVGGYEAHDGEYSVSANGNNCFANYHWRYTEYYYLPGRHAAHDRIQPRTRQIAVDDRGHRSVHAAVLGRDARSLRLEAAGQLHQPDLSVARPRVRHGRGVQARQRHRPDGQRRENGDPHRHRNQKRGLARNLPVPQHRRHAVQGPDGRKPPRYNQRARSEVLHRHL